MPLKSKKAQRILESQAQTQSQTVVRWEHNLSVYYKIVPQQWNAGADPIYRGDPGCGSHLDRDGDGVDE